MFAVHIFGNGRAFDDGQHAVAHAIEKNEQQHQAKLDAAQEWRGQQCYQRQRYQAGDQAVGQVQVEVMFKKIQQHAPQHLQQADAGRNRDDPSLVQAAFAQQAHHVRRQRCSHGHQQHEKNTDQEKWGAAQMP